MKAEKIRVFESGTSYDHFTGDGKYFPFAAAAEEFAQKKNGSYSGISGNDAIRLGDEIYLLSSESPIAEKDFPKVSADNSPLAIMLCTPTVVSRLEIERNGSYPYNSKYVYSKTFADLETHVSQSSKSISKVILLRDDETVWFLKSEKPIILEKFTKSLDMAKKHALGKLTQEEKKILGLT